MIGATHLITGAALGALAPNWWIAAIGALVLHFLLDTVPHTDYGDSDGVNLKSNKVRVFLLVEILIIIGMGIFLIVLGRHLNLVLIGAVFGMLPDLIQLSYIFLDKNHWKTRWITRFHGFIHWHEKKLEKTISLNWSIFYQAFIWIVCILLLIYVK